MSIKELAWMILEAPGPLRIASLIAEASVHRPRRGTLWVAAYRDGTGRPRWRSTGLTNRRAALIVAQEWERAARRARAEQGEAGIRVRFSGVKGGPGLTQREVAMILRISERAVRDIERRAIEKLRRHPTMRALWGEWIGEDAAEDMNLTDAEVAAVYGLARTGAERRVLDKLVALMAA